MWRLSSAILAGSRVPGKQGSAEVTEGAEMSQAATLTRGTAAVCGCPGALPLVSPLGNLEKIAPVISPLTA